MAISEVMSDVAKSFLLTTFDLACTRASPKTCSNCALSFQTLLNQKTESKKAQAPNINRLLQLALTLQRFERHTLPTKQAHQG